MSSIASASPTNEMTAGRGGGNAVGTSTSAVYHPCWRLRWCVATSSRVVSGFGATGGSTIFGENERHPADTRDRRKSNEADTRCTYERDTTRAPRGRKYGHPVHVLR